ncbi:hypothetical protein Snoj_11620 [Streptomyces nojiriensis]|uniref:Uncharacterized protein n=1 Tax=Streptomyces nojiriensis TaxID=66374 RepID=A0ABQ3SGI1_9ACTN|nr:hypothetical protein GCM10010205_41440 [Streptomyces nojiriensis]GHI67244.1 hypothetical protein Snoj_11620 [Streptomyces nojiriensis]
MHGSRIRCRGTAGWRFSDIKVTRGLGGPGGVGAGGGAGGVRGRHDLWPLGGRNVSRGEGRQITFYTPDAPRPAAAPGPPRPGPRERQKAPDAIGIRGLLRYS